MIVLEHRHLLHGGTQGTDADLKNEIASGFRPSGRDDLPHWPLASPIDWAADPFKDRNWLFQLSAWYLLRPHLTLFTRRRDPAVLRAMLSVVLDWYAFHIERGQETLLSWKDMAVGRRASIVAFLVNAALRGELVTSDDEMQRLHGLWRVHFERLADDRYFTMTNHGLAQIHGLMALCRVRPDDPKSPGGVAFAVEKFAALLKSQFDDEGMHREHSPDYHFFVLTTIRTMAATGWYSEFAEISERIRKAEEMVPWLVMPDGRTIPIGDTDVTGPVRSMVPQIAAGDETAPWVRKFDIGYGIVRSPWAAPQADQYVLFLMGAFHSHHHKHMDDLSVFWNDRGADILIDPGKFSYTPGTWREYFLSTRAHNTVEIDDRNFSRQNPDAYGSALRLVEKSSFGFVLEGRAFHPRVKTEHVRQIVFAPQKWLIVIDRLRSQRRHHYTQWFHFSPSFQVSEAGNGHTAVSDAVRTTIASAANVPIKSEIVSGVTAPRLQGWTSVGYNRETPCPTLGLSADGSNVDMVTVFALDDAEIGIRFGAGDMLDVTIGQSQVSIPMRELSASAVSELSPA